MRQPATIESLYIDFDAFFANAEKQLCPGLRGRAVGVLPLRSEHTSLIACCYVAKAAGVRRGMSISEARALCPDIVLPVARHDEYVRLHHRILAEIDRHLPVRRIWSIDEMECALVGSERQRGLEIARAIQTGLRDRIGPWVTPSIGLAPNQFLAKVAAEMNKPNGLVALLPEDLPGPLAGLALTDLPGIAGRMEARLAQAGVRTVMDLWNLAPKHARHIWGSVEGERFWAQLRGLAVSRPETVRRMFGHGRNLSQDWRTPARARDCLRLLTAKAARRLRREGYLASAVSISFATTDDRTWHTGHGFEPARDDRTFLRAASRLFDDGIDRLRPKRLRKVSVMLSGLSRSGDTSADLFELEPAHAERVRWERLTDAMDSLNARYEACVVSVGPRREPPGGYAGAKIAFGRVPDLQDFAVPLGRPSSRPV